MFWVLGFIPCYIVARILKWHAEDHNVLNPANKIQKIDILNSTEFAALNNVITKLPPD